MPHILSPRIHINPATTSTKRWVTVIYLAKHLFDLFIIIVNQSACRHRLYYVCSKHCRESDDIKSLCVRYQLPSKKHGPNFYSYRIEPDYLQLLYYVDGHYYILKRR